MSEQREDGKEWTIKGGWYDDGVVSGHAVIHCDGPVPAINEQVKVIEKSAFDRLKDRLECVHCATFKEHEVRVEGIKSERDTAVKALLKIGEMVTNPIVRYESRHIQVVIDEAIKSLGILPVEKEGGEGE